MFKRIVCGLIAGSLLFALNNSAQAQLLKRKDVFKESGTNTYLNSRGNNFGIGTSAPVNKLQVAGNEAIGSSYINSAAPTDGLIVQGNVGIGTNNPDFTLAVVNSSNTNGFKSVNSSASSSGGGAAALLAADDGAALSSGDRLGFLSFAGSHSGNHSLTVSASIDALAGSDFDNSNTETHLIFKNTPSGSTTRTERLRIQSDGNIGIGTTLPGQVLDVTGNARASGGFSSAQWTDPIVDYHASGIAGNDTIANKSTITTTTGTISSGTNSLVVADASGYSVGMGIAVATAGTAGTADLITTVTAISGTTFTLAANASATASSATVFHDDTAAINAACADGRRVHLRRGSYYVTSTLTSCDRLGLTLVGDGSSESSNLLYGTNIVNRGLTNNVLQFIHDFIHVSGISVKQGINFTQSAGYSVLIGGGGSLIHQIDLEDMTVYAGHGGIKINGNVFDSHLVNLNIFSIGGTSNTDAGIYYNNASPAGDVFMRNLYVHTVNPGVGIRLAAADTTSWNVIKVNNGDPDLLIKDDGAGSIVAHQRFIGCSFESGVSATNPIVQIKGLSANKVYDISFTGGESGVSSSDVYGMSIEGHAKDISIAGGFQFLQLHYGLNVSSDGGNISLSNNIFHTITNQAINLASGSGSFVYGGNTFDSVGSVIVNTGNTNVLNLGNLDGAGNNVGLGTTAPAQKLEVVGTTKMTALQIGSAAALTAVTGNTGNIATTTGSFTNTHYVKVDSNNNFIDGGTGTGATTPTGGLNAVQYAAAGSTFGGDETKISFDGTNLGIGTVQGLNFLDVRGSAVFTGNIGIGTTKVSQAGAAIMSGNVGIGTWVPSQVLSLGNNTTTTAGINFSGTRGFVAYNNTDNDMLLQGGSGKGIEFATNSNTLGSGTVIMTMPSGGNVGISTTNPGQKLDVFGSIRQTGAQNCSTGVTTSSDGTINGCVVSDEKAKNEITSATYNPDLIKNMRPVTYKWKDKRDAMVHSGFIAQDLEKIYPSAVIPAGPDYKGIDPSAILAGLVQEVQQHRRQIDFQKYFNILITMLLLLILILCRVR